ncbi:hypothetical protein [Micromonospora carbonacea]|uniref:LppX_LprAFG lipoprotein n=1 Tax=Micromonospora carbonacea TaxID=47853 RepID=A0A1C5A6A4_9ACTN|nr:hypothetical protein [Micromonospora carbonacea]SCF40750.1 hypothetical protein GA0070563_111196 [Micromonospora carbonacea]
MIIRRWSAGVLAAALFVPGLTACNNSPAAAPAAGGAAAPAAPADPKEALLASTRELSKGNFTFAISGGEFDGSGTVHMPSKSAEMKMTGGDAATEDFSMDMHLVFIDTESWVKLDLTGPMVDAIPGAKERKGKYQHLDRSKIKDAKDLQFDFSDVDPAGSEALTKAVTDVRKTGEGTYEGTLDATKVTDSDVLDADIVKGLADKAGAVPFTAKLDAQGRLVEFLVKVPAAGSAKAQDLKVTYADYGAATAVPQPPANLVVEASDDVYEMFKG